jgi:hypothetical protein
MWHVPLAPFCIVYILFVSQVRHELIWMVPTESCCATKLPSCKFIQIHRPQSQDSTIALILSETY